MPRQKHPKRANQPEDCTRCSNRLGVGREEEGGNVPCDPREDVGDCGAFRPEEALNRRSNSVERHGVDEEVKEPHVKEHGCEEAIVLPVDCDHVVDLGPRFQRRPLHEPIQDEHAEVGDQEEVGHGASHSALCSCHFNSIKAFGHGSKGQQAATSPTTTMLAVICKSPCIASAPPLPWRLSPSSTPHNRLRTKSETSLHTVATPRRCHRSVQVDNKPIAGSSVEAEEKEEWHSAREQRWHHKNGEVRMSWR
mmetsp:Transcript_4983/g.12038  ORF Transcript_4983/g.12038 Transcript_4983/m.12038 type:complete len:251 (+) Transcript_4983:437-1189(+)